MKKVFLILFLIPLTLFANLERRRDKVIGIIRQELNEVVRIVKMTNGRNAEFIIRMAELHFELARQLRDRENAKYLKLPIKKRQKTNKKQFFAKSQRSFNNAQKAAKFFLKRHPGHPDKGEVYNILAKNAQEFQKTKTANKYFKLANRASKGNKKLQKQTSISMAEDKYNKKKYRQAIPLYERALKGTRDRWYTKDAYNLSWCYFRVKNYSRAISTMKEVHRLSGKGNYINMKASVERDLAYFYVKARRVDDAIAFYKSIRANIPDKFIALAKYLAKEQKYSDAAEILKQALKYGATKKQEATIYTTLLELYERYGKYTAHLKACQRLFALDRNRDLSRDSKEVLIYQVKRLSAKLQKQVASKTYKGRPKIRQGKALMAVKYFKMLTVLEPDEKAKWNFFTAETYYAIGYFESAIPYYDKANKQALDKGDRKMADRAINALLAALGKPKIKRNTKTRYTLPAFNYYLENYPKSKRSYSIYQRTFNLHFKKRQMKDAERILMNFSKNFPQARGKQEAMIAQVIDYYKKRKNYKEVERWTERVTKGEFNVSDTYTKKVRLAYVSTKIEKIQRAEGKGAKKEALEGYMEIYGNKLAGRKARVNASYNIATIFFEMGDVNNANIWALKSLAMRSTKEKLKFASSYMAFGNDFLNRREFSKALTIYKKLLNGICRTKSKYRKSLYQNIYTIELAQKFVISARSSVEGLKKCGIPLRTVNNSRLDVLLEMSRIKRWRDFNSYLIILEKIPALKPRLIEPLDKLRAYYIDLGLMKKANSIKAKILYLYRKSPKKNVPASALDIVANYEMANLNREAARFKRARLKFPMKVFPASMQRKFKALERVRKKAASVFAIGSSKGIIGGRRVLVETHEAFIKEVERLRPPFKEKKNIAAFKKDMRMQIIGPLKQNIGKQIRLAKNEILKNNIFSRDNNFFLSKNPKGISTQYFYPDGAILMDRGGGK
ncbi:MAG: tetratricopeptide repeat protein [Deltaproteobacteria bacterium]|nr:MAG: tetratricopeptide repeat protein [Deltaproteobacteria bacterium]